MPTGCGSVAANEQCGAPAGFKQVSGTQRRKRTGRGPYFAGGKVGFFPKTIGKSSISRRCDHCPELWGAEARGAAPRACHPGADLSRYSGTARYRSVGDLHPGGSGSGCAGLLFSGSDREADAAAAAAGR